MRRNCSTAPTCRCSRQRSFITEISSMDLIAERSAQKWWTQMRLPAVYFRWLAANNGSFQLHIPGGSSDGDGAAPGASFRVVTGGLRRREGIVKVRLLARTSALDIEPAI